MVLDRVMFTDGQNRQYRKSAFNEEAEKVSKNKIDDVGKEAAWKYLQEICVNVLTIRFSVTKSLQSSGMSRMLSQDVNFDSYVVQGQEHVGK